MRRSFEFSVATIAHTYRQLFIGGRVLDGIVAVGDRFTHLRCRFTAEQEQTDDSVCVVDLIVQRILFYGRYINRLDSGMTCEIEFSGDLSIRLGPDDVLMGESEAAPPVTKIAGYGDGHVL